MPSVEVGSTPALVVSTSPLSVVLQNTGNKTIFISGDSSVGATVQNLFIAPNVSFDWPANTPLWAICRLGQASTLAYSPNGAHIGTASPSTPASDPQYLPAANPNTIYLAQVPEVTGIYRITCPVGTIATVNFYDASGNLIISAVTVAGTIVVTLPANATSLGYYTDTGINIVIVLQLTGTNVPFYAGSFTLNLSALDGENVLI